MILLALVSLVLVFGMPYMLDNSMLFYCSFLLNPQAQPSLHPLHLSFNPLFIPQH